MLFGNLHFLGKADYFYHELVRNSSISCNFHFWQPTYVHSAFSRLMALTLPQSSDPCFDRAKRIIVNSFLLIFPSRLKSHPFRIVSSKSFKSVASQSFLTSSKRSLRNPRSSSFSIVPLPSYHVHKRYRKENNDVSKREILFSKGKKIASQLNLSHFRGLLSSTFPQKKWKTSPILIFCTEGKKLLKKLPSYFKPVCSV